MSLLTCDLARLLYWVVNVYTLLMFVYAVISWIPDLRRGRWVYALASVIEPVLMPIRRIIPPVGGLDLAFLIVILVLQLLVRPALGALAVNSCVSFL
ncbi:MAG TPA: YggT family protein [Candidatus Cybelea sp.]